MTLDPETLAEHIRRVGEHERNVIARLLQREVSVPHTNRVFDSSLTFGQRLADQVAALGGSWTFILLFLAVMAVWILLNVAAGRTFDPYPFILLNLVLSMLAALQAPVIMMSQNRQAAKDRLDASSKGGINSRRRPLSYFGTIPLGVAAAASKNAAKRVRRRSGSRQGPTPPVPKGLPPAHIALQKVCERGAPSLAAGSPLEAFQAG